MAGVWLRTQCQDSAASLGRTAGRLGRTAQQRPLLPVLQPALPRRSPRGSALSTATPSSTQRSPQCLTSPPAPGLRGTLGAGAAPPPRSAPAGPPNLGLRRLVRGWRR